MAGDKKGTGLLSMFVLVSLGTGLPLKRSQIDKKVTQDILDETGTARGYLKALAELYDKADVEPLVKGLRIVREYFKLHTVGYLEPGKALVPVGRYQELDDKIRMLRDGLNEEWRKFKDRWPEVLDHAKKVRNGTWDPKDYPLVSDLPDEVHVVMLPHPHPKQSAFVDGLEKTAGIREQEVADAIRRQSEEAVKGIRSEIAERIAAPLRGIAEKMEQLNKGAQFKVYDSLFGNLREAFDLVKALAPAGSELETRLQFAEAAAKPLLMATADTVKGDDADAIAWREKVKETATSAASTVAQAFAMEF